MGIAPGSAIMACLAFIIRTDLLPIGLLSLAQICSAD